MVIPDRMQHNSAHCGPVAIAYRLGIKAAQVMVDWPDKWTDHRTDRKWWLWPIDTPWNHRKYLERTGQQMIEYNGDDWPVNSIVLLHNVNKGKNPITSFFYGLFFQHWVRVVDKDEQNITVDFGTEEYPTRVYDRASFKRLVDGAWPRCVYEIGGTNDHQAPNQKRDDRRF